MVFATSGVLACLFAANALNALLFPTKQHEATYVSVVEADKVLSDEQIIYVIEINGEARGYPQDHLELPHVAGANIGGEEVVMTYCGLSSLPVASSKSFIVVSRGRIGVPRRRGKARGQSLRCHHPGRLLR